MNWLEGRVLKDKPAMMIDDLTSMVHKTAIHGATILRDHEIPLADYIYAMVFKTDTPDNTKIRLLGREITVSSMFNLTHFDLELEAYQKNKQLYPWQAQSPSLTCTKNSSISNGALAP